MSDLIDPVRRRLLAAAALVAVGTPRLRDPLPAQATEAGTLPHATDELESFRTATAWLNSPALTAADLQGRIVLVDIGTYTCINWLRTLPYVRAWSDRYKAHGLVVIGVHSPEFLFEHDLENARRAMQDMRVEHPIAIDNTFSIWRAFRNRFWPSRYLIDARGRIRHQQFGEGDYDSSERAIQQALTESGARGIGRQLASVEAQGIEAAPNWSSLRTPETYVGYERAENFALSDRIAPDQRRIYAAPARLRPNRWALSGDWTVKRQAAVVNRANGRIVLSFHARDLHLVMGPASRGEPVRYRVLLDGEPPGEAHGGDVNELGEGTLTEPRLHQLIRQPTRIVQRQFAIEFLDAGAEAFAFTFG